ncbi:hypothetical protein [Streptacidiphilus jiangxiensis]|uniref:Uncharacterized protein n=1 Tax=Streptacidiphilus jiangxiensis TaxID=235985 RepID=A0A1H8AHD9_STRJI|nr:hypothetical protein [Streptacidiphilus jiangxiensis]SEM70222.1 hypothetical protein SAMN05414137_14525 [Streptacidiphilus jiangxiensis]
MSHDEEQQRQGSLRADLHELARTLPALLDDLSGRVWTACTERIGEWNPSLRLVRDDGMRVNISAERLRPGRLQFYGGAADSVRYWERDGVAIGSMTATRAKTPAQVAADIRRRLVPLLDAAAVEIGERRARHAAMVAHVARAVRKLATVPGVTAAPVTPEQRRDGRDSQRSLSWNCQAPWRSPCARVKVTTDAGRIRVELEAQFLTPEMARAALAAMDAAYRAQTPAPAFPSAAPRA